LLLLLLHLLQVCGQIDERRKSSEGNVLLNLLPTVLELFGYTCVIKNHFPCCTHESGESKKPDPNPAKTWELTWFCLFYNLFWILSLGGTNSKGST
jgi:hypothetical protein